MYSHWWYWYSDHFVAGSIQNHFYESVCGIRESAPVWWKRAVELCKNKKKEGLTRCHPFLPQPFLSNWFFLVLYRLCKTLLYHPCNCLNEAINGACTVLGWYTHYFFIRRLNIDLTLKFLLWRLCYRRNLWRTFLRMKKNECKAKFCTKCQEQQ